jgi:hypothetical protein
MAGRQFDGGSHFRKPPLEHSGTNLATERETMPTDNSMAVAKTPTAPGPRNLGREAQIMPKL